MNAFKDNGMRGLFSPAIKLMNKLGYTKKFMVLGFIYLVAITVMFSSLYRNFSHVIDTTQRELQGITLIKPLTQTMQHIQQHHSVAMLVHDDFMRNEQAKTEEKLIKKITLIEERLPNDTLLNREESQLNKEWRGIKSNWHSLRIKSEKWSNEQNFAGYIELTDQLQQFKETLADYYGLNFDADEDVHYLTDIVINTLPDLLEKIEELNAICEATLVKKELPESKKEQILVLLAELNQSLKDVDSNLVKIGHANTTFQPLLNSVAKEILKSVVQITNAVNSDILSARFTRTSQDFFRLSHQNIEKIYTQNYETLLPTLESLLVQRMKIEKKSLAMSLASAVFLFLIAQYFFIGIYYAMMGNIESLAHSAQKFADGNLSSRITLDTQDELAIVAHNFNVMASSFEKLLAIHDENEAQLNASQAQLRALVQAIPDLIWLKDKEGIYLSCNTMFERYLGVKEADLIGKTDYDFVNSDVAAKFRESDKQIMETGIACVIEENIVFAEDGRGACIEAIKTPLRDNEGNIIGVLGIGRNITTRKKAEDSLRKFSLAVEQSPCNIVITDLTARIEYANKGFELTTGYSLEEILGKTPKILNSGKTPRSTFNELWTALRNGERWRGELINRRKDGSEYIELAFITPVRQTNGEITHYLAIKEDITERKKLETEQRIASIAFESQEGIIITDANNVIIRVNKAFTTITGYSAEDVIGQTPSILKSGREDEKFYKEMWQKILATGTWQGEIWNRNKNEGVYPQWLTISAVKDEHNQTTHYVATLVDISEYKVAEEKIKHLAFYDPLTGLANRRKLIDSLNHSIAMCDRENLQLAVLMMDLDRFKAVNDTLGHLAGDELLKQVALRIFNRLRNTDLVARLGGDEFVVLLEDISNEDDAARVATDIVSDLSQPFVLSQSDDVRIGSSIGIALYPQHGTTPDILMDNADIALYQAKDNGRGCFAYFSESLTIAARERLDLEARLRRGIEQGELRVYYQAQVDILSNTIIGAEALVRWEEPNNGLVMPYKFIPIAEETGLILQIGEWVLRDVCQQGKAWLDAGYSPIRLAVNVSPAQFKRGDMVGLVTTVLAETNYPAEWLELELTESGLMEHQEAVVSILNQLRDLGLHLAIDDFGTGYSSLAYLKRFPLDVLKIDKSFIDDIPHQADDMAIASAIISMGQTLGFKVLAEGVETPAQLNFLQLKGCDIYQGYIKSKPIPADEFVKLLHKL